MIDINDFLGKKNSTRNLSDDEFELLLPELTKQLENVSYIYNHSDEQLNKDWIKLCNYKCDGTVTSSVTRVGSKLCDHFFPNFFNIKNSKGVSYSSLWNVESLDKVLRWNRKSHSTPYLSEIRRGIYFCCGLTKNTMYRPHMAKMICDRYKPSVVLDPCCGWGGRMLGVVTSGSKYVGFETNTETYDNLIRLSEYLNISDRVVLYNMGSEKMDTVDFGVVDVILTSPPYFDLEIYSDGLAQSENMYSDYSSWKNLWLKDVINKSLDKLSVNGVSYWNVHNIKTMKMIEDVKEIHVERGFDVDSEFGIQSSARQSNQNKDKNKKNKDLTICYRK